MDQQAKSPDKRNGKIERRNLRVFLGFEAVFNDASPANQVVFAADAGKLAQFLADPRGYYESARPQILKLLAVALRSLRKEHGLSEDIYKGPFTPEVYQHHPLREPYMRLVSSISPHIDRFTDPNHRSLASFLLATIGLQVPPGPKSSTKGPAGPNNQHSGTEHGRSVLTAPKPFTEGSISIPVSLAPQVAMPQVNTPQHNTVQVGVSNNSVTSSMSPSPMNGRAMQQQQSSVRDMFTIPSRGSFGHSQATSQAFGIPSGPMSTPPVTSTAPRFPTETPLSRASSSKLSVSSTRTVRTHKKRKLDLEALLAKDVGLYEQKMASIQGNLPTPTPSTEITVAPSSSINVAVLEDSTLQLTTPLNREGSQSKDDASLPAPKELAAESVAIKGQLTGDSPSVVLSESDINPQIPQLGDDMEVDKPEFHSPTSCRLESTHVSSTLPPIDQQEEERVSVVSEERQPSPTSIDDRVPGPRPNLDRSLGAGEAMDVELPTTQLRTPPVPPQILVQSSATEHQSSSGKEENGSEDEVMKVEAAEFNALLKEPTPPTAIDYRSSSVPDISRELTAEAPLENGDDVMQVDQQSVPLSMSSQSPQPGNAMLGVLYGDEMKVITFQRGLAQKRTTITYGFELDKSTVERLRNWKSRNGTIPEVKNTLCLSMGCYSVSNLDLNQPFEPQLSSLPSTWPQDGGLATRFDDLSSSEKITLSLAPPFVLTPDDTFDLSSFINIGHNAFEIVQTRDYSQYIFVLFVHHPTQKQIRNVEEKRKKDALWEKWKAGMMKPPTISLRKFFPFKQTQKT